jgi:hypothetical protein
VASSFSRWAVVFGRYAFLPVVFALAPKFDTSPPFLTVFEGWWRYESTTCI